MSIIGINSCGDSTSKKPNIIVENTTKVAKNKSIHTHTTDSTKSENIYMLKTKTNTYNITLSNKQLKIEHIDNPIILINLFSQKEINNIALLKPFTHLENKYTKKLFILNIFDDGQDKEILNFIQNIKISLHIAQTTSVFSVLYKNGLPYSHFEGIAPIEMIHHDIKQAIKE